MNSVKAKEILNVRKDEDKSKVWENKNNKSKYEDYPAKPSSSSSSNYDNKKWVCSEFNVKSPIKLGLQKTWQYYRKMYDK